MYKIADEMTKEERTRYKDEGLCGKMSQLKDECDWLANVPALEKLLAIFEFVGQDQDFGRIISVVEATSPRARKRRRQAYYQSSTGGRSIFQLPLRGSGS
ncbi:uncharacterized protein LY89DRAFT_602963 [Mollisia scopiformis]|uniref:Uncharacterized protein n=1 Tax=Mollisia scopiformis TaxID=149040 RepID=A0A132B3C5_MOLSC|nr:uncharacterized protein LY89DRAFT_602963 [Mollisia scopiformis]KUJ06539.1 hypothetical protein LY89DRAFT_602963 [Mollisia scopiformis]